MGVCPIWWPKRRHSEGAPLSCLLYILFPCRSAASWLPYFIPGTLLRHLLYPPVRKLSLLHHPIWRPRWRMWTRPSGNRRIFLPLCRLSLPVSLPRLNFCDRDLVLRDSRELDGLRFEGAKLMIFPEFSVETQKLRKSFDHVKLNLRQRGLKYSMLFPGPDGETFPLLYISWGGLYLAWVPTSALTDYLCILLVNFFL